ncbi:bifunctional adenosylcobinamide kinase/adenosylcobinamide-phosphate guanylyltransferase [Paenibacillus sp. HB172176]|uniref:bifunctional adenosylcobinamide kinase/adenosylcobinamide-phosphate guanylyltransferase n=1 Tax=Paenibacillus sp. HB172176 TaxID=2493690 RepID=UPI001439819D|nr:bifunctional adenosylcobinamide kinase/adenosylcobinamide-phosphate guanylyltransferase [Paenibacillus sp. HB172176]
MAILITGGARSGKSQFAERYAARVADEGYYIATCEALDDEMRDRIRMHQANREASSFAWTLMEEPLHAAELLIQLAAHFKEGMERGVWKKPPAVLLDCLTLWLTNWQLRLETTDGGEEDACLENGKAMEGHQLSPAENAVTDNSKEKEPLETEIEKLTVAIQHYPYPLLLVTNEVGDGIVPSYSLGRAFRDEAGRLNQRLADSCDRVFLVTAGIPVELKSLAFDWETLE